MLKKNFQSKKNLSKLKAKNWPRWKLIKTSKNLKNIKKNFLS